MKELFTKEEVLNAIPQFGHLKATLIHRDGHSQKVRLARAMGGTSIIEMAKGSRRYGYPVDFSRLTRVLVLDNEKKPESQKWVEAWTKVLTRLEKSGLWSDMADSIRTGLAIGYDKVMEANTAYWKDHDNRYEGVERIDPRFMNISALDGRKYVNTDIVWNMSRLPKVKKMYFGKYVNETYLARIRFAFEDKRPHRESRTVQYDVSFNYDPEKGKAWYSEEYRNCGNGHYYIALDATHALFMEDD